VNKYLNNYKIFDTAEAAAEAAAVEFTGIAESIFKEGENFFTAISGGSTPKIFFKILAGRKFKMKIDWGKVHLFWADERMVPPDDSDSNYGTAKKILIEHIPIPQTNIHRIYGESDPEKEVRRYAREIESLLKQNENKFPCFDLVLLGIGEDGHTASLFPGKELIMINERNICGLAENPSGQKRITLTKETINNARNIIFLVSGSSKAEILSKILSNSAESKQFPAAQISPYNGSIKYIIDKEAAELL
jgi:6-phosphogluconolactonase